MLRQLRQRFGREMRRDRVILQLRAEPVADLLIDRIDNFLTRKHGKAYRELRGFKTNGALPRHSLGDGWSMTF